MDGWIEGWMDNLLGATTLGCKVARVAMQQSSYPSRRHRSSKTLEILKSKILVRFSNEFKELSFLLLFPQKC